MSDEAHGMCLALDQIASGRRLGAALFKWSETTNPPGYHLAPIISLKNGTGRTISLNDETQGGEFQTFLPPCDLRRRSNQKTFRGEF